MKRIRHGKLRVFADTNAIFEAFHVGCWFALCDRFSVETVDKCVEESLLGRKSEQTRAHPCPCGRP